MRYSFAPFIVLAIVFFVLGINGQRTFFYIAIVFAILGLVMMKKRRKA